MALTITITGDQAKIDAALPIFARAHGWVDGQLDPEGNAITALQAAEAAARRYFRGKVKDQSAREAKTAAIDAANTATESALDGLTLTVTLS